MGGTSRILVISGLVLTVLAIESGSAQPTQDLERASRLSSRWTRIAYTRFAEARALPSDASAEMLENLIVTGAANFVRERAPDSRIAGGDQNIRKFADVMVGDSGPTGSSGARVLDERAFARAKGVCPLYPFC